LFHQIKSIKHIQIMKKISVAYWRQHNLIPCLEHNQEFDYSIEKQNEIINTIINNELSVMVRPNMGENKDVLLIYIDTARFGQY
jgi:hypothetical protein